MTVKEALEKAKSELKSVPVEEPEASAEFLLRDVLGMDRAEFFASLDNELKKNEIALYDEYIARKKKHEPVWQIVGKVEFYGLDFEITEDVLIPRPETEFLVEEVLKEAKGKKGLDIVDIGTGAGPIIIALAKNLKNASFYASDVSKEAVEVAKQNAKNNNLKEKIEFKVGGLWELWKGEKFDIVTANLPYIPHEDLPGLSVEIHHYEPRISLDGGEGGLVIYEEFIKKMEEHLNPKAVVFCEIGKNQGKLFTKIVQESMPNTKVTVLNDLAGFDRIVKIES